MWKYTLKLIDKALLQRKLKESTEIVEGYIEQSIRQLHNIK